VVLVEDRDNITFPSTYIIYLFIYLFIYLLFVFLQWEKLRLNLSPSSVEWRMINGRRVGQNEKEEFAAPVRCHYNFLDKGSKNTKVLS
jgi:hypothetical protein